MKTDCEEGWKFIFTRYKTYWKEVKYFSIDDINNFNNPEIDIIVYKNIIYEKVTISHHGGKDRL